MPTPSICRLGFDSLANSLVLLMVVGIFLGG
jgi:hypothetical protein